MIGRTEMAQSKMRFLPYVLEKCRRQSRRANPGLAGNQHRMPLAVPCSRPAAPQQRDILVAPDERRRAGTQRLEPAELAVLADDLPSALRLRKTGKGLPPQIAHFEEGTDLAAGAVRDDNRVRFG